MQTGVPAPALGRQHTDEGLVTRRHPKGSAARCSSIFSSCRRPSGVSKVAKVLSLGRHRWARGLLASGKHSLRTQGERSHWRPRGCRRPRPPLGGPMPKAAAHNRPHFGGRAPRNSVGAPGMGPGQTRERARRRNPAPPNGHCQVPDAPKRASEPQTTAAPSGVC